MSYTRTVGLIAQRAAYVALTYIGGDTWFLTGVEGSVGSPDW